MANTFDVIVLGLGGMGSAAAYHLSARKKRVLGIEQFTPAHERGSSHGGSRIIRQAYYEDPAYVPLVLRAYELWEQLERDSSSEFLQITGGLAIGPVGSTIVAGTLVSATEHNLPYEVLESSQLRQRYPALNPRPGDTAVYEARAGFLRPEAAVRAHLQQASRCGAELHFEEKAVKWEADSSGSGVRVITSAGAYEADRLIIAPGAWAPDILADLKIPFDIRRHVMCWFDASDRADLFLPQRFPVYIWDVDGTDVFYGFPATDGIESGVKAAMHTGGRHCTAETIDRLVQPSDVEELRAHLARFIPALNGPLLKAATCMYALTPDEHFVLSLHPLHSQIAVAAGFSGHGFKFTSVIGEVLAELVTTGATRYPIALFSPARFNQRRSASSFE